MTRFELYDTNGKVRYLSCELNLDQMRICLGMFKTHCAEENSEYEFNHFRNWLKKNSNVSINFEDEMRFRVDM